MQTLFEENTFRQSIFVCLPILMLALNGCTINSDSPSYTTQVSNNEQVVAVDTRPASNDMSEDWTDTSTPKPLDLLPPNLDDEPIVSVPHCTQDSMHIYGLQGGCLFSIEEYNKGQPVTLSCEGSSVLIDGKVVKNARFGRFTIKCD